MIMFRGSREQYFEGSKVKFHCTVIMLYMICMVSGGCDVSLIDTNPLIGTCIINPCMPILRLLV